jgi:hypothetical protein
MNRKSSIIAVVILLGLSLSSMILFGLHNELIKSFKEVQR